MARRQAASNGNGNGGVLGLVQTNSFALLVAFVGAIASYAAQSATFGTRITTLENSHVSIERMNAIEKQLQTDAELRRTDHDKLVQITSQPLATKNDLDSLEKTMTRDSGLTAGQLGKMESTVSSLSQLLLGGGTNGGKR